MNDVRLPESCRLLSSARGVAAVLRVLVLVSPMFAVGCTWLAAGRTVAAIDVAILGLAVVCAVLPDSHLGLLVVMLVGIDWLVTVDAQTTPWAVGSAISLAVFHASMAASIVAPPAARWTRAMCHRWLLRTGAVTVASAATWAFVAAVSGFEVPGSGVWLTAGLLVLALTALWAREGTVAATAAAGTMIRRARRDSNS
jgi:hypothetical protein